MNLRIAFIINGLLEHKQKTIEEIQSVFDDFEIQFYISEYHLHIIELCKTAIAEGFNHICIVGGDGSVNEAANGIISAFQISKNEYDWQKILNQKLIIYPRGNGNDFARMVYKNAQLSNIRKLLEQKSFRRVDVGLANFVNLEGESSRRFFINITDLGIGGEVVKKIKRWRGVLPGKLNYSLAILTTFLNYKKRHITVQQEDFIIDGKALSLVVANGKYFGKGLGIAPAAKLDDGEFSVVHLANISISDYLKNLPQVKACKEILHPEVRYSSASKIFISPTKKENISIDMDGECVGFAPIDLICLQQRITILSELIST